MKGRGKRAEEQLLASAECQGWAKERAEEQNAASDPLALVPLALVIPSTGHPSAPTLPDPKYEGAHVKGISIWQIVVLISDEQYTVVNPRLVCC